MEKRIEYDTNVDEVELQVFVSDEEGTEDAFLLKDDPKIVAEQTGLSTEALEMLELFVTDLKKAIKSDLEDVVRGVK